jgi:hypothetical protein
MAEISKLYRATANSSRKAAYGLIKNPGFNRACDKLCNVMERANIPWKKGLSRGVLLLLTTDKPSEAYNAVRNLLKADRASIDWVIDAYIKYRPGCPMNNDVIGSKVAARILSRTIRALAARRLYNSAIILARSFDDQYCRAMSYIDISEAMWQATLSGLSCVPRYEIEMFLKAALDMARSMSNKAQRLEVKVRILELGKLCGLNIDQN